jgi:D-arabinose 1-dehydrogenase-like Zn-dependent alcohol dehydrogenase
MVVPIEASVSIPGELSFTEAAPIMCAAITTYNALRNSGARPGDVVAILVIGGLGHIGIQFASKLGFKTIAISRGKDKEELVKELGAIQYIDSKSQNPVEELVKLGGAKIILGTASSGKAMTGVLGGLAVKRKANHDRCI